MRNMEFIFGLRKCLIIFILLLCIIIGAYTIFIEPVWVEVNKIKIIIHNLPAQFDGFKIVHLSDFHCSPFIRMKYIDEMYSENIIS
jgi:hypothetical protein